MKIGITGTRKPLAPSQIEFLEKTLAQCTSADWLLHGDCVGADATAHDLAVAHGLRIEVFPPSASDFRAFKAGDLMHAPKPYRERNQDIVDACDLLIALPLALESQSPRSGTWMTVRMLRRTGKTLFVVLPDPVDKPGLLP